MKKNILIISSRTEKNDLLLSLFDKLILDNFSFYLLSDNRNFLKTFLDRGWQSKKIYLGPKLNNDTMISSFILTSFLLSFKMFFHLAYLKFKTGINILICLNTNEKIISTLIAKLLGFKIIWFEYPDISCQQFKKPLFWLYLFNSKFAKLITFNSLGKIRLKNFGLAENKIATILPGIKSNRYQENIFNNLAKIDNKKIKRQYFTIGTITSLDLEKKLETLLQAIRICQSMIPNLQLIIIGEGQAKKNLLWLAKKMEIDNLIWFVGEQSQLKKWLENFNIFVICHSALNLDDYGNLLYAMAAGLPVIGPRLIGLEDMVDENKTGSLIDPENSEMLARQIIKLYQDKHLRLYLGENGKRRTLAVFTLDKMENNIKRVLEYS